MFLGKARNVPKQAITAQKYGNYNMHDFKNP